MMQNLSQTEIEQIKELLDWWAKMRSQKGQRPRFDHSDSVVRSVRLGRKLYEKADLMARTTPEYRSISRMIEMMLWEKIGAGDEYLVEPPKDK